MNTLWKMPLCSAGRASDSVWQLPGRDVEVAVSDGDELGGVPSERLIFGGVESFRVTYHRSCTPDMSDAYDRVIELSETAWLVEVRVQLLGANEPTDSLRHLRLYLDDGPCYEFICGRFRAEASEHRTPIA